MKRALSVVEILERALERKASDIVIMGGEYVAYKVHGRWQREVEWGLLSDLEAESLIRDMLSADLQEVLFPPPPAGGPPPPSRDLDFSVSIPSGERFRVNAYRIQGRVAAVLRPIPGEPLPLESLGLPLPPIEAALRRRKGMILVTGPTGSGKSTTLAAMVEYLNGREEIHIVTVEDPMEFFFTPKKAIISQREVGRDVASFSLALRSALRQAPDVIMVGEMRDLETIQAAITAAETGHLVLATLHTRSAPEAITRIIDVFPEGYRDMVRLQLSAGLSLVISQVLLPRADGAGRVLAYDILVNTPAVANLIREGKVGQIENAMSTGRAEGMLTMTQCLKDLMDRGLITPAVAASVVGEDRIAGLRRAAL